MMRRARQAPRHRGVSRSRLQVVLLAIALPQVCLAAGQAPFPLAQSEAPSRSPSVPEAIDTLTGGDKREWIHTHWETFMGASTDCTAGLSYKFYSDGTLLIQQCVAGKIEETSHQWRLRSAGGLDLLLTVDDTPYTLRFFLGDPERIQMRLRPRVTRRIQETVDQWFQHFR